MKNSSSACVIDRDAFLENWQGHRRLTRRVIEAFPEDELFRFSIGSMRTFGAMADELLRMATPMARGAATGNWVMDERPAPASTAELLRRWDEASGEIEAYWSEIPDARFLETDRAFGRYEGPIYDLLAYAVDNEIHHRGQGYVYLRALGIEPPHFFDRS